MSGPKQIVRQRDFSGGELVEYAKRRDDEPIVRSGARSLRNVHILASGAVEQRPGRSALFQEDGCTAQVRMSATYTAHLCFGEGTLTVRNSSGTVIARAWGYDWTAATANQIVWAQLGNDVVITFPGQIQKIARWDAGTEWTFLDYAVSETSGGQKRTPFLRIAPKDITLLPSARTGTVNLTFSENYLVSGMVGTRIRFVNRQIEIATVTSGTAGTGTVKEPLPGSQVLTFGSDPRTTFTLGEIVEGSSTGSKGYITALAATTMTVQLVTTGTVTALLGGDEGGIGSVAFTTSDSVVGPGGGLTPSSVAALGNPVAVPIWDEEVFNSYRGYPRSVFADQSRLGFCDFPAVPEGIAWSAVLTPDDLYPGADADAAIFETAPRKARVYHVTDGADEFVLTDVGIYYIPISESNPLRPGSVSFRRIPGPAASKVEPVSTAQGVAYVNAGLNRMLAIVGTGQTAQPYIIRSASDLQSHLFSGIVCLEVDEGQGDQPDDFVYVVNTDGTVAVGRFQPGKEWVGWVLWEGEGDVKWVSALGSSVLLSTDYTAGGVVEQIDDDRYLDAAVDYDAIPTPLGTGAQSDLLIPDDQGTTIGNMTAAGGLAAAFDGTTSQAAAAAASKTASTTGAVGKTFGQSFKIAKAEIWPSSDLGFTDQATVTITLRAKAGTAPADYAADGTQLATTGSISDVLTMQTLTSGDEATEWDHAWALLTISSGITYVAELRIYTPGATHGSGELWFLASNTLKMMDGLRNVGDRVIDANGEVTLQEGDVLTDQTFGHVFGDVTIEPFIPHVGPGQSVGQSMNRRQISDMAVAVQDSTGFRVEKWNANEQDWDVVHTRSPYDSGDNESIAPPLREEVRKIGSIGADHDPRVRIVKDYPGPLRVLEIGFDIGA